MAPYPTDTAATAEAPQLPITAVDIALILLLPAAEVWGILIQSFQLLFR